MGIHYDYKSTRGAKKLQKQQEREERRRKKKQTPVDKQKAEVEGTKVLKPNETLTLDMLTDPARRK